MSPLADATVEFGLRLSSFCETATAGPSPLIDRTCGGRTRAHGERIDRASRNRRRASE